MKLLTWVILTHLFLLFSLYNIVVKYSIRLDYYYVETPKVYYPEYPCVIMEGPGVKYIMEEPCGNIDAVYLD